MDKGGPLKDEALVIKSIRYGESSRILTLFTRTRGKVAVIAKGARRVKTGVLSGVETSNLIEAIIYFKASRSVQTLGQVTVLKSFPRIKQDLILTGYVSAILEMLNLSFLDEEPNPGAFEAAVGILDDYEDGIGDNRINFWSYQLSALKSIGFAIDPYTCPVCERQSFNVGSRNLFWIDSGAVCCPDCQPLGGNSLSVSGETVNILRRLTDGNSQMLSRLKPSLTAKKEITAILEKFLKYHHPGINNMPALKMLDNFENLPGSRGSGKQ